MFIDNKSFTSQKRILIRKKENKKVVNHNFSVIVKNKVLIPSYSLLTNGSIKKEKSTYVLNNKLNNLKSIFNRATCYVDKNKDNRDILKYLKINIDRIQSFTTYAHKGIGNKIIIKDNTRIVKYNIPYSGGILEIEEKETIKDKIKDFKIVAQKYSYIEYYMDFGENTIKNIEGLPQGIIFGKNCLKGTPMISGNFSINIELNNQAIISGTLSVPSLPRQL